jgi:hypothetical protein
MALMTISRKREFQSRRQDISASFVRNLMKCNGFGRVNEQSVKAPNDSSPTRRLRDIIRLVGRLCKSSGAKNSCNRTRAVEKVTNSLYYF